MSFHSNLTSVQRRELLRLARRTAERELSGSADRHVGERPSVPGRFGGAFVTLYNERRLRGCIGTFAATTNIVSTVESVTRSSLADPRFENEPITGDELPRIDFEISILSDLLVAEDPKSLVVGQHGVKVVIGDRSGCFLPKVGVERGWSAEEFLSHCCSMKAGLPPDAWKNPNCRVYCFEADIFSESAGPGGAIGSH